MTRTNEPKANAVGSGSGNTVSVVNLATMQITSSFTVGAAPAAIGSDGKFIYTANYVAGNLNTGTMSKWQIGSGSVVASATIGPAAEAFTATVGGQKQVYGNPTDYQVLWSTPGTVSGGLYNVAGRGEDAANYPGFVTGQVALIPRDVAQISSEYLQAAVDRAVHRGAAAVIFYNASFSGDSRTPVEGLTGTSPGHAVGGHAADGDATGHGCDSCDKLPSHDTSRIAWAKLMARVGEEFPLECPACGGDIRLIAFITEPGPIRKILTHLGEPLEPPPQPLTPKKKRHRFPHATLSVTYPIHARHAAR